jgi:hypothetical protein
VFSLDVTTADYHSLEAGLQRIAEHTGGFFARTHIFPTRAVQTLLGALAGHYTLFVELPALGEGTYGAEVTLARKKGNVLARATYIVSRTSVVRETGQSCRTTDASDSFVPPSPYPADAPGSDTFWYGTPAFWTSLPANGTWGGLPRGDAGYRQKVFLWRPGYDGRAEQWPDARVSGRRLDGKAGPVVAGAATNAFRREFGGWAMLVEIEIPTAGCWEITAAYGDDTLTFTVRVEPRS